MEVYLNTVGKGALVNLKYSKEEMEKSFVFVRVLDKINRAKKEGKDRIVIDVEREKVKVIEEILKDHKFDVKIVA